ncbi:hypothetical protein FB566_5189 [Stackebrandtia endophytica]|uniref:DUF308 domain-containing protein n=1 Tax=Stackebrandtia endophytica TaxID=1496996 RepID=A0A543B416_9ACTN|nr:hypothetical protein [Stackebrandtia endophytica]TQL79579.1 hypothetical protein FB566_5189 [Stackebrandtia endophytica]
MGRFERLDRARPTVVSDPGWLRALVWLGFPFAGAMLVWFAGQLVGLSSGEAPRPLAVVVTAFLAIPEPARIGGAAVIGAFLGAGLSFLAQSESLTVVVSARDVRIRRGISGELRIPATEVAAVFADGTDLVVQDAAGMEPARERHDLAVGRLRRAFLEHGYRWSDDGDPHAGDFRRWFDGTPELPERINRLLRDRATALRRWTNDRSDAIAGQLRTSGVIVRDHDDAQYWRKQAEPL